MKKILLGLSFILLLVAGCANTMNTPTKKVEELSKKLAQLQNS